MKKQILALSISTALLGMSAAQAEVTLFDYQEASSSYEEAYVAGNVYLGKNRGDEQTAYNIDLNANYDRTISTPDRDLNLRGDVTGTVARSGAANADSTDSYTASASVTADNYFQPGSNGGFWYGSASVAALDTFDDLATTASIGVGYGRVTNVTPMAKTIRLMDELVRRNVLRGKPATAVYQQVAGIVARESEYVSRYGARDYDLKWIGDIEAALQGSGLLRNLGAEGVLKARDVLVDEYFSTRRTGWKVRAGVGYVGSNFDGLTNKPLLEAGAEYHRPLDNQTQLSDEANVSAILNDGDNGYNFNNNLSLTREIDDRIDWENSWNLAYAKNSGNGDDVTTNTLASTFVYELNNSLDFTTTARIANVDGSTDVNNPDGTDRALTMGVRYRLR